MARFNDLSNELVLGVLEEVLPEDIVSVSLISKRIYQLAGPRLEEHRILQKRYTNFRNMVEHKPNNWHDPGWLLADLLCKIVNDARIGRYVKKMDLDLWNSSARGGWQPDAVFEDRVTPSPTRPKQASKTHMEIIEEAVRAVEIIPKEEVDDWLSQIRRGNEDPLVALLLLHAPNLHTLKFVDPYNRSESSYLLKTIRRAAGLGSTAKSYPLQLKSVEIYFAETWESLDFVKAFMSLPSLTSIKTESLFVDGRTHEANSIILPQPSNVTEMSFRSGFLPEIAFEELLQGVKNLKSFAYNFRHLWRDESYTPLFDCFAVLGSVEAHASHTLEHLKLSAEVIETSQFGHLRGFHALRDLEIQTSDCFAAKEGKLPSLASLLPVSLERLALSWYETEFVDEIETLTEAFSGLVRENKTRLPHLRRLDLYTRDQGVADALLDCLGSDDIAQSNPMLSFKIQGPSGSGEIPSWADNVCTCGQDCFGNGSP